MASRFNEILHGEIDTLQAHLSNGNLDVRELGLALSNLCGKLIRLERRVKWEEAADEIERQQTYSAHTVLELDHCRQENQRLREALQFYADEKNYPDERLHRLTYIARQALEQHQERANS